MNIILNALILGSFFITVISLFPPLSIVFPMYKLKKTRGNTPRERVIINMLAMLIIGVFIFFNVIDWGILVLYIVFSIPELLYYLIQKFKPSIPVFDRISISSLIMFFIMLVVFKYIFNEPGLDLEKVKELYKNTKEVSQEDLNVIFGYIKRNAYLIIFIYAYLSNYLANWAKFPRIFNEWQLNYLWTIPYLIFFGLNYVYPDSIIYSNGEKIMKVIFIGYGVKAVKCIAETFTGKKKIAKLIAVLGLLLSPTTVFIVGVFRSLLS